MFSYTCLRSEILSLKNNFEMIKKIMKPSSMKDIITANVSFASGALKVTINIAAAASFVIDVTDKVLLVLLFEPPKKNPRIAVKLVKIMIAIETYEPHIDTNARNKKIMLSVINVTKPSKTIYLKGLRIFSTILSHLYCMKKPIKIGVN